MREEVIMQAVNDIDTIARLTEDLHEQHFTNEPDYWTKLHHQAAIAAMQGIMTNIVGFESVRIQANAYDVAAEIANSYATALVEKLKNEK